MPGKTLLIIDGLINLLLGLLLVWFPRSLVEFLGLPVTINDFYPNILGAVLLGIAIALFIESRTGNGRGLGLLGAVSINLCAGLVLGAWLLGGDLAIPMRGLAILWFLVVLLVGISAIEFISGTLEAPPDD